MALLNFTYHRNPAVLPCPREVLRAKQQQRIEREAIARATGVVIGDDDQIVLTPHVGRGVVRIHCSKVGCNFAAVTRSEGRAYRALATHLVVGHMQQDGAA